MEDIGFNFVVEEVAEYGFGCGRGHALENGAQGENCIVEADGADAFCEGAEEGWGRLGRRRRCGH